MVAFFPFRPLLCTRLRSPPRGHASGSPFFYSPLFILSLLSGSPPPPAEGPLHPVVFRLFSPLGNAAHRVFFSSCPRLPVPLFLNNLGDPPGDLDGAVFPTALCFLVVSFIGELAFNLFLAPVLWIWRHYSPPRDDGFFRGLLPKILLDGVWRCHFLSNCDCVTMSLHNLTLHLRLVASGCYFALHIRYLSPSRPRSSKPPDGFPPMMFFPF